MTTRFGASLPGLLVLGGIAAAAHVLGTATTLLSPLVFAILLGVLVFNAVPLPQSVERGVSNHSLFLETAIVLLGASLSWQTIATAGPILVTLVVAVVGFGLLVVTLLSRAAGLDRRTSSLLAAGASVCGVSAVAAVAPACDAEDSQIAHAAATILLFDALTLVAFPAVGRALHLDSRIYGVWIGLAMFSTGPVAAAGFAHSATAGEWATMTKLARNSLIGVVAVWYSFRGANTNVAAGGSLGRVWSDFPKFLVGFLALAVLANAGVVPDATVDATATASDALFLLAFAGLGSEIRPDDVRDTGVIPAGVVGVYLLVVSATTYLLVSVLF